MTSLLLLHPLGATGSFWDPCLAALPGPAHCPDLLGHGATPPGGATLSCFTEHVVSFLDERECVDPLVVVGISLGGLVAQGLVVSHPDRVAAVVLVDTVSRYPQAFRNTWAERIEVAKTDGMEPLADVMEETWFTEDFRRGHPEIVAECRRQFLRTDLLGYVNACQMLGAVDIHSELASIARPTYVLCGTDDAPFFVESANEMADLIPDVQFDWFHGAKHACVLEQPDLFGRYVKDFVGRLGS